MEKGGRNAKCLYLHVQVEWWGCYRCLQEKTGFLNCVLSKQKDVGEDVGGKIVSLSLSPPTPRCL